MRHSFNDEGRCVFCDMRWHRAVGTECQAFPTDRTIKVANLIEVSIDTTPSLFPGAGVADVTMPASEAVDGHRDEQA